MAAAKRSVVMGVFTDHDRARRAVQDLRDAGFGEEQIGVIGRHAEGVREGTTGEGTQVGEAAAAGAATGAGVGALWALGIVAGVLPAIGPVIAGGVLASVLASAAGGAAVGGLVGALIGLGLPEEEATYYKGEVEAGRTLVTVRTDDRVAEARAILDRHGAYDMHTAPAAGRAR
jgi:hypothetical protein